LSVSSFEIRRILKLSFNIPFMKYHFYVNL
jgi:hypothetical protein